MMHENYQAAYMQPYKARDLRVERRPLAPSEQCQNVKPVLGRLGLELPREQVIYTVTDLTAPAPREIGRLEATGAVAGELRMIELRPGTAYVSWVHTAPWARFRGIAEVLHRRVVADYGELCVEDFAAQGELCLLGQLTGRGFKIREWIDGVAELQLIRYCTIVSRMFVLSSDEKAS
jgi:hypothetical protein